MQKNFLLKKNFDFAIFDLNIPGEIGGKKIMKDILEIYPKKVIASSGYSNDPVIANYKEYGFAEVISKPYTINNLNKIIFENITGKKWIKII